MAVGRGDHKSLQANKADIVKVMESPLPSFKGKEMNSGRTSPSSSSPMSSRLWKPAAQRNLRNQWSKMLSGKDQWISAASKGRSHATALVNSYLSRRYLPKMELGVLKDMHGIRKKAAEKLVQKQELACGNLLSSYKDMVVASSHLVQASSHMRCFLKGSVSSNFIQFSDRPEDEDDLGDGGGVPAFSSFTIPQFENLAREIVEMFVLELSLKRLLVLELLVKCKEDDEGESSTFSWLQELYPGEFDGLRMCRLISPECCQPIPPRIKDWESSNPLGGSSQHTLNHNILQVYLTTWLADVNIDSNRISEILVMVEEEMQVKLS